MSISDIMGTGQYDLIEYAGNMLDRHDLYDSSSPSLMEVTGIGLHRMPTASGLNDYDYQDLETLSMGFTNLNQLEIVAKVPIPPEILEHFKNIKCHCMMGLFPEIGRAWLSIDSDIYIWTYEQFRDVAYFDGLNQLIVSVGLVRPKPGVFIPDVKYLLILTTAIEIVVLGVTFNRSNNSMSPRVYSSTNTPITTSNNIDEEMQLMNKPIFILNTDGVAITTIIDTDDNRLFLGGRDGCLYEICYQAESNWLGKRCKKINHSQGLVSYMIPGFLKVFSETDSIAKIVVDNSRHLLYTLSEKGAIEAWDLGVDCYTTKRIARISQNDIVFHAGNVLKTVDISVFKPIISLCALTIDDSPNLHLLAITQAGVRIYFSTIPLINSNTSGSATTPSQIDNGKPQNLYLMHVRLPPGYTPNTTIGKPRQVHSAYYNNGTLLMVQSGQQDQDLLWSLSSEPFPWRQYLAESSVLLPLNGQVWSIAESPNSKNSSLTSIGTVSGDQKNKVLLLTNQGVYIIALLQPTDLLEQLLIACNGPHHEAIKAYFQIQSEHQACATSVLLACRYSASNAATEISKWATQIFLLYGGEPKFGTQYLTNQPTTNQQGFHMANSFTDPQQQLRSAQNFMSTPFASPRIAASSVQQSLFQQTQFPLSPIQNQSMTMRQPFESTNICYSAKHAGLYLYASRLLRPIWNRNCLNALHNYDEILSNLSKLSGFIDYILKNNVSGYIQNYNSNIGHNFTQFNQNISATQLQQQQQQQQQTQTTEYAYAEEKKSINALAVFIKHTCEVIGLWQILRDHQFHKLLEKLPKDEQNVLLTSTFRDLILLRADSCALLIVSLINSYLSDNATVGLISKKLRNCCPNLYRHEDAITHKATELIMLSKKCNDTEEQKENLHTALQLCKDAAPNIPLSSICQQFIGLKFYQGVIEIVATCADKIDPNGAAIQFYKNNEQIEDQEGYVAYKARINFYKEIKLMLDQCYTSTLDTSSQIGFGGQKEDEEKSINSQIEEIISMTLNTQDQLLHITVYEWLLSYNLLSKLLNITDSSLGDFLTHSVSRNPDNLYLANILWKYHEQNGEHAAATKILENLATMQSKSITLNERIEYLARAVLCMRSDTIGYSVHNGRLLKNLEDKLEIAQIQNTILKSLEYRLRNDNRIQEAILSLNFTLYNMTQLYTDFAERFNLWECQLTILNCSHHNDPLLIELIWTHILDETISRDDYAAHEKLEALLEKFHYLAKEFGQSGHCFPLAFLVRELEIRCCRLQLNKYPVPNVLLEINIDIVLLLDIYSKMISMNERIWAAEGNEWHLIQSISCLMGNLASNPNLIPIRNRRRVVSKAQDLASACRNLLYPKPDKKHLIDALVEVEAKLQRILS